MSPAAVIVLIIGLAAIIFVWKAVMGSSAPVGDGTPGTIMDAGEDVRRVDLGEEMFVAQQAERQLREQGLTCRVVTLESGAFGMGMGAHHYLVYNAEDEAAVTRVTSELLEGGLEGIDDDHFDDLPDEEPT